MENTQNDFLAISPEDIHKALDELEGLGVIDGGDIIKGEGEGEEGTNAKITSKKKSAKGKTEDEDEEEDEVEKGEEEEEFEEEEETEEDEEIEEDEEESEDEVEKALDVSPVLRKFDNRIQHISSQQNQAFANVGKIMKGMFNQMQQMSEQIQQMSGQSAGRKSVATAKAVDRFEKGETGAPMADGRKVLNQRIHKGEILDILDNLAFAGNKMDDDMAKAMTTYELNTPLQPNIISRIEKEAGVKIV